jgi:hypothetical protein
MTLAAAGAIAAIVGGAATVGTSIMSLANKPSTETPEPITAPSVTEPAVEPGNRNAGRLSLISTSPQGILSTPNTARGRLFTN